MNVKNKIPKNVKLKTYLITVLLISVIFAGILNYSLSAYIGDVGEVWVQPPFHEASYVVGVYNSTFYYGKNGTTGDYEFLSTNASYVIEASQNSMGNGGEIYFKEGVYEITAPPLVPKRGLTWTGAGMGANGTIFKLMANSDAGLLRINGETASSYPKMVTLKDFRLEGNKANYDSKGLFANATGWIPAYTMITRIAIYNFNDTGFYTKYVAGFFIQSCRIQKNNGYGMYTQSSDNMISDCYIGASGKSCLRVFDQNNNFVNMHVWGGGQIDGNAVYGVWVAGQRNSFVGGQSECNARIGILIDGGYSNTFDGWLVWGNGNATKTDGRGIVINDGHDNIISNCQVYNISAGDSYQQYAIREQGSSDNNTITNNNVRGNIPISPVQQIAWVGSNTIVENNIGFTTENSGTATISSSTTVVFDHGLAGTPTLVLCSFNVTGWTSWKWSATSTQITVTVETSGTYEVYWCAKYKP